MGNEEYYEDETGQEINKDDIIEDLSKRLQHAQGKNIELGSAISHSSYSGQDANLIQYQIDNTEMLEQLEHFYRGEYIGVEGKNQVWKKPKDPEMITFNEFGVSALMEIVTKYVNKNTSLSYYSEERIYEILGDLGDELILFILCNYEKMGMDTYFKKTKFRIIIVTTLHIIESCYRKAIRGRTSDDINQSRIVTQSDVLGNRPINVQRKRGLFNKVFNPGG